MYIALDKQGNRIDISEAIQSQEYFCPICQGPVIIKDGKINAKYFAHGNGVCSDNWHYDMSEWHRHKQEFFPMEAREVVVTNGSKTHRADILIGKTVVEIQHSHISAEEFSERNQFFNNLGYRVAWIFDVTQQFNNGNLFYTDDGNDWMMTWKHPVRIFAAGPQPSDFDKNYAIWLTWDYEEEPEVLYKVIWTAKDDYGAPSFSRFVVSSYGIGLNDGFEIDEFFYSKKDYLQRAINELKSRHSYSVKYIGEKGKAREAYICPLRKNEFGVKLGTEKGCLYCRYCYIVAMKKRQEKTKYAIYCCYPKQVRELEDGHPGFDCGSASIYEI